MKTFNLFILFLVSSIAIATAQTTNYYSNGTLISEISGPDLRKNHDLSVGIPIPENCKKYDMVVFQITAKKYAADGSVINIGPSEFKRSFLKKEVEVKLGGEKENKLQILRAEYTKGACESDFQWWSNVVGWTCLNTSDLIPEKIKVSSFKQEAVAEVKIVVEVKGFIKVNEKWNSTSKVFDAIYDGGTSLYKSENFVIKNQTNL